jgi:hypothetical protein
MKEASSGTFRGRALPINLFDTTGILDVVDLNLDAIALSDALHLASHARRQPEMRSNDFTLESPDPALRLAYGRVRAGQA